MRKRRGGIAEAGLLPSDPDQGPLVLRPRARREAKPTEAGLVQEVEIQPVVLVAPAHDPVAGARRVLDRLVGWTEGDEDFAAIGAPARNALVLEALVGSGDPAEVLIERLVLRRRRVGIGGGVELAPEPAALRRRRATQRGDPIVLAE